MRQFVRNGVTNTVANIVADNASDNVADTVADTVRNLCESSLRVNNNALPHQESNSGTVVSNSNNIDINCFY